jgi:hypothetical protein
MAAPAKAATPEISDASIVQDITLKDPVGQWLLETGI